MSTYEANRYNFSGSAITALNGSNIASGTVAEARLADLATTKITSGTFADARFAASNITQHVDLSNLNASNLTSGSIPNARVASGAVTQHVSAVTNTSGSWTPSASDGSFSGVVGRYHKTGNLCMCFAHAKFSGRTSSNDNQFFINGLPFTSKNSGDTTGGGFVSMRNREVHAVIRANESRIRMYTPAADMFTGDYWSTEYLASVEGQRMVTNRNLRQSSNNGSQDNVIIEVYFITA